MSQSIIIGDGLNHDMIMSLIKEKLTGKTIRDLVETGEFWIPYIYDFVKMSGEVENTHKKFNMNSKITNIFIYYEYKTVDEKLTEQGNDLYLTVCMMFEGIDDFALVTQQKYYRQMYDFYIIVKGKSFATAQVKQLCPNWKTFHFSFDVDVSHIYNEEHYGPTLRNCIIDQTQKNPYFNCKTISQNSMQGKTYITSSTVSENVYFFDIHNDKKMKMEIIAQTSDSNDEFPLRKKILAVSKHIYIENVKLMSYSHSYEFVEKYFTTEIKFRQYMFYSSLCNLYEFVSCNLPYTLTIAVPDRLGSSEIKMDLVNRICNMILMYTNSSMTKLISTLYNLIGCVIQPSNIYSVLREIDIIRDSINYLSEGNESGHVSLPVILLNHVVLEHTLLCIRRMHNEIE